MLRFAVLCLFCAGAARPTAAGQQACCIGSGTSAAPAATAAACTATAGAWSFLSTSPSGTQCLGYKCTIASITSYTQSCKIEAVAVAATSLGGCSVTGGAPPSAAGPALCVGFALIAAACALAAN